MQGKFNFKKVLVWQKVKILSSMEAKKVACATKNSISGNPV
jgi:hypothetical protein